MSYVDTSGYKGKGYGRSQIAVKSSEEQRELQSTALEIESELERLQREMESAATSRQSSSSWGSLLGLGIAALVAPWAAPAIGGLLGGSTAANIIAGAGLMAGGSWLGAEAGETLWDLQNRPPATDLGVEVGQGLFFQGDRSKLKESETDISESLSSAWDLVLEGMDESQTAQAMTTFTSQIFNPISWLAPGSNAVSASGDILGSGSQSYWQQNIDYTDLLKK